MKKLGENPTEDHLLDLVNKVDIMILFYCDTDQIMWKFGF